MAGFCSNQETAESSCLVELLLNNVVVDSIETHVNGKVYLTGLKTLQVQKGDVLAIRLTPQSEVTLSMETKMFINHVRVVE